MSFVRHLRGDDRLTSLVDDAARNRRSAPVPDLGLDTASDDGHRAAAKPVLVATTL